MSLPQQLIEEHARFVDSAASALEARAVSAIDLVVADVTSWMYSNLRVVKGKLRSSPDARAKILYIEEVINESLARSDYYPSILAYVHNFVEQVPLFRRMYSLMISDIPDISVGSDYGDRLGSQGAAAVAAIEGQVLQSMSHLRQLLSRSLNESDMPTLVKVVTDGIRRMNRVKLIAKDQMMVWFRLLCSLSYEGVENSGSAVWYQYVGAASDASRDFCKDLSRKMFLLSEIVAMDNGQMPGVFLNCGGHGCLHWWSIGALA